MVPGLRNAKKLKPEALLRSTPCLQENGFSEAHTQYIQQYALLLRKDRHRRPAPLSTPQVFSSEPANHGAWLKEQTFGKSRRRASPLPEASTLRPLVVSQRHRRTSQPRIGASTVEHAHLRARGFREPQSSQSFPLVLQEARGLVPWHRACARRRGGASSARWRPRPPACARLLLRQPVHR